MPDTSTKVCAKCKDDLPIESFAKNRARRDGRQSECRTCRKPMTKKALAELRAESALFADSSGQRWTAQDDATLLKGGFPLKVLSQMLGRRYSAVAERRRMLRAKA